MSNLGMGKCDRCDQDAIVKVNKTAACGEHINEILGETLAPVKKAVKELGGKEGGTR